MHASQASPMPSWSASSWDGLATSGQLSIAQVDAGYPGEPNPSRSGSVQVSHTSPAPSASASAWPALATAGQLSGAQVVAGAPGLPRPSASGSTQGSTSSVVPSSSASASNTRVDSPWYLKLRAARAGIV